MKEISIKKKNIIFFVGIFLCLLFLFLFVLSVSTTPTEIDYYIDPKTLDVTYSYSNFFLLFLSLSVISLILSILSFVFLVLKRSKSYKRLISSIVFAVVLIFALVLSCLILLDEYSYQEYLISSDKQSIIKRTPKYTETTIGDFLDEVNRFPTKYNEKIITLEGRVEKCSKYEDPSFEAFKMKFCDDTIEVIYNFDESVPRVVKGDYVVVTGKVYVFYEKSIEMYKAILVDSTYVIKED